MIRIAICDDEETMLDRIHAFVRDSFAQHTQDCQIYKFSIGEELIREHNQENFDVIFLDIDMPEISGFDVAKKIRDDFCNCFVIFVTNHSELIYESFDFQPFHFIQKSVSLQMGASISKVVKKLMVHMKQNDVIRIEDKKSEAGYILIRNILYMESDKHNIKYYIINREEPMKMRGTMKENEDEYEKYDFVRIHKRYLVNMRHLVDIDAIGEVVLLNNGKKLSLSRSFKSQAEQKYKIYLRTRR